jgi:aspartate-semialdehyde dehydrogenase
MGKRVAVAGATGAVGAEILRVLERRNFPVDSLRLLASERSVGKKLAFRGEQTPVEELKENSFKGIDIALFSAGKDRSLAFCPAAVKGGAIVVDNSSAFRMDDGVPLVVPEINPHRIREHKGIIANPNCSTIIMVVVLWPLHRAARIKRIVASTYQAVSGTGQRAIIELEEQTRALLSGGKPVPQVYPYQIAFNLLPHIGNFYDDGYTDEEVKLMRETRKIMEDDAIQVTATTIRVPVFRAHSESVNIQTARKLTVQRAREILSGAPGVKVVDDPAGKKYPMPIDATGRDDVLVGRLREDPSIRNGLDMWISGDQLLKGAALNAVQIAEYLL